jgi:hypothetical protein
MGTNVIVAIMVYGGWIGTENTNTGGVRMGVNSGESCLIGSNFPSQAANVATARLRIASPNTKLGITGRELIFDSSTIRVKTNIEDYPNSAYESIRKIRPVLYTPLITKNSTTYENTVEDTYETYPMPNPKEYIGKQGGFIAEWLDEDTEMRRYVVYGKNGDDNPYVQAFMEWWPELSQTLQEVRITGGEPSTSFNFWNFMDVMKTNSSPNLN